jgi:hypothetical protein
LGKRNHLITILVSLAISFAFLAYPFYVIRPFRHQGQRELAIALQMIHLRPGIEMLCAVTALLAGILYWRAQPTLTRKIGATFAVLLVFLFTGVSRINMFEIMFKPMGHPNFSAASDSKLDGGEMVMAVRLGGEARAYPIRIVSYHHIVNDVVGGLPIVATY